MKTPNLEQIEKTFDCWSPLTTDEIRGLFRNAKFDWILAGGIALDLFIGKITRAHDDIDILVPRNIQDELREYLSDWDVWVADPPGTLRPWEQNDLLKKPIQDIWCKKTDNTSWQFQIMLFDVLNNHWVYKRDSNIIREYKKFYITTQHDIKIISPEIQLLYKSHSIREKDQFDFENVLPHLSTDQKKWLKDTLNSIYSKNHKWIEYL